MRSWRDNPLIQFSLISFVVMAVLAVSLSVFLANSVRDHVLDEAAREARDIVATKVVKHLTPEDLERPMAGARLDAFHRFVTDSVVSERTARVKLWNGKMVLYSDDFSQIGTAYPPSHELAEALEGGIAREISVPQKAENERERLMGTLIEVYAPIVFPGSQQASGAFEIYQYYSPYASFISDQRRISFTATFAAFGLLYGALFFIVARGWRATRSAQRRTERSLQEVRGLNNLLVGYLDQRQHLIEEVQNLQAQPVPVGLSDRDLHLFYVGIRERLKHIAEEASQFPRPVVAPSA